MRQFLKMPLAATVAGVVTIVSTIVQAAPVPSAAVQGLGYPQGLIVPVQAPMSTTVPTPHRGRAAPHAGRAAPHAGRAARSVPRSVGQRGWGHRGAYRGHGSRYGGWGGHRYRGHGYRYRDHDDDVGAAIAGSVFGLALGAIVANGAHGPRTVEYCARRFRSYDPASGTYLGYDGLRHPCP